MVKLLALSGVIGSIPGFSSPPDETVNGGLMSKGLSLQT